MSKGPWKHKPTKSMTPQAALKAQKVFALRLAGATFEQIAQEVGYRQKTGAHKAYQNALRDMIREPAEDCLALDLARLDRLLLAWFHQATGGRRADGTVVPSDPSATDRVLRILRQREELLGLFRLAERNAEKTVSVEVPMLPDDVADAMIRAGLIAKGKDPGPIGD